MRSPSLGSRALLATLLAAVLTAATLAPSAEADPSDPATPSTGEVRAAEERAETALSEVERVQQRLDAAAAELEWASIAAARAAEDYNGARWRSSQARRELRLAIRNSARAQRTLEVQKAEYRDVVINLANTADLEIGALGAVITADGLESLVDRSAAGSTVQALLDQRRDAYVDAVDAATAARSAADKASDKADAALVAAREARDAAQAAAVRAGSIATRIEGRKARLVRRLARLEGISVELARARQDAHESGQRWVHPAGGAPADPSPAAPGADAFADPAPAEEPAPAPDEPDDQPAPPASPAPPPSAGGAQAAIAFARDQIGERYVWGAAGPDSWDCSGLTSKAWQAGGKYLPHYSVAQYEQSTPISIGQLRPGDLVFWSEGGPDQIFHVALYSGGGRIIHAPRTGKPVTEESMYYWRLPDYYARP